MNQQDLKDIAELAKEKGLYFIVELTVPDQNETEFWVTKPSAIDTRLAYYLDSYDENLEHRGIDGIKIVDCKACDLSFLEYEPTEEDVEGMI